MEKERTQVGTWPKHSSDQLATIDVFVCFSLEKLPH